MTLAASVFSRGNPEESHGSSNNQPEALVRQTVSEREDNYCSGQLGSSVLSRGKGRRGCLPSWRVHSLQKQERGYRPSVRTQTHTKSSYRCVGRRLSVADSHAEPMMKIHSLLHAPPPTNCYEMFVFRLQREQRKKYKPIFSSCSIPTCIQYITTLTFLF